MSKIIGIDLGTTNSCVAVVEGGSIQIIPNNVGGRTTPSAVGFTERGERLIGQIAKRQAITNSRNTVFAVKRLMGRRYDSDEIQRIKPVLPYELTKSAGVVVEQIIRPTGLIDPPVEVRPVKGQIDDLLHEIRDRVAKHERAAYVPGVEQTFDDDAIGRRVAQETC